MQTRQEQFIVALLDNDRESVARFAPEFNMKDDISSSDFKELQLKNQRIYLLRGDDTRFMSIACQNSNEEIIRILHTNEFEFSFANLSALYKRDPGNFAKLMEKNPSWFPKFDDTVGYCCLTNDRSSRTNDEQTAYFAEYLLSTKRPHSSLRQMVTKEFLNALDITLFTNRIEHSQKKITKETYDVIVSVIMDKGSNKSSYLFRIIESKFKTQHLKPLEMSNDKPTITEKQTLESLNKKIASLEHELVEVKSIVSNLLNNSKKSVESYPTLFSRK